MTKTLLRLTAALEFATGAALLAAPSAVAWLLVGAPLETSAGLVVARVAGAALLSLGVACWTAPARESGHAAWPLTVPMLGYNVVVATLLVHARVVLELSGIGLWPAVVLHAALAVWCVWCLTGHRMKGPAAAGDARFPSPE